MTWSIIIAVVVIHLIEILGILFYLLLRKNSKLEKILINQNNYINAIEIVVNQMSSSIEQLDEKIWVENDPELKTVFENFKLLQNTLKDLSSVK